MLLNEINKFEKLNHNVSVNVYGFIKGFQTHKNKVKKAPAQNLNQLTIIPLKICDRELKERFDL